MRKLLLKMVRATAFAAIIAAAVGASVVLNAPAIGSAAPVTGTTTAVDGSTAILMISDDQMIWWDKTHGMGTVASGQFVNDDWVWNAAGDPVARVSRIVRLPRARPRDQNLLPLPLLLLLHARLQYMGVWIVPPSFDLAGFSCEGMPVPAELTAAAVATSVVDRTQQTQQQQQVSPSPTRAAAPGGGSGGGDASASPAAKLVASGAGAVTTHAAAALAGAAALALVIAAAM